MDYSMEANAIYEGDNLEILSKFPDNSVDLIYADPPFFSNRHYEVIWDDGAEIRAFQDRWKGGIEHYTSWMESRLRECHRVLKPTGTMFLHCDYHANAHLRILMDTIFKDFLNEIIWCYKGPSSPKMTVWGRKHDVILWFAKGKKHTWNVDDVRFAYAQTSIDAFKSPSKLGGERSNYCKLGKYPEDWWTDIPSLKNTGERLGYPTQKPLALLERIIKAASNKGDIVLDPFCGCGTALVSAQNLGRKWVGIDVSPTACKLMKKRMQKECHINVNLISGKVDLKYVQKLAPFEFQNWVVANKFMGKVQEKKSGDMGIDGFTPQVTGGFPIQVKQSEGIGRNVIDNFETAIRRMKKTKGYIVAYSFGKGAHEECARVKNQEGVEIILRTVQDLLDGKTE